MDSKIEKLNKLRSLFMLLNIKSQTSINQEVDVIPSYRPKTKMLQVSSHNNPAIFVPELKRIVWGMESWWGAVKSEDELKEITDEDIDNVWYVKLLKSQMEGKDNE